MIITTSLKKVFTVDFKQLSDFNQTIVKNEILAKSKKEQKQSFFFANFLFNIFSSNELYEIKFLN